MIIVIYFFVIWLSNHIAYAHTHWDTHTQTCKHTHLRTHSNTNTRMYNGSKMTSDLGTTFLYLLLYNQSLLWYFQMSALALLSQNSWGNREEDVPPTAPQLGWCRALCSVGNKFQTPTMNPQWGMTMAAYCNSLRTAVRKRKKRTTTVRFQLKQTNKLPHRNLRSCLSVSLESSLGACVHCHFCNANMNLILMGKLRAWHPICIPAEILT